MPGLTTNGLEIRTEAEIQALIEAAIAEELPGLDLSVGPEHQIIGILSEELAIMWELLQAIYSAGYPESSSGTALDRIAAITGTTRRAATSSRVIGTVNLNAGVTLAAGAIASVDGDPDALFRTVEDVTNPAGIAANVDVELASLDTGPIAAPAGTLTQIVTPRTGWNLITNAADATLGRDVADDAELREQRVLELAGAGVGTVDAIRAAVARVDGVEEVTVYENTTLSTDVDGRPGKSFEVVIWDGDPTAADDAELAQAIWDNKPAGIEAFGVTDLEPALDDLGTEHLMEWTRAAKLRVYVALSVVLKPNAPLGWEILVQDAIEARGDEYNVGDDAYASHLICAVLEVPSIEAVIELKLEKDDPTPDDALVVAGYQEIVRIDSGDVTVTEA